MARNVATADSATKKWTSRAGVAAPDYVAGATAAATHQADNAIAQADSWLAGVSNAGVASYKAGLTAAKNAGTYATRIQSVGGSRFTDGVSKSANVFTTQIAKVLSVEAAASLSPKGPKGSAANAQRSTEMQQALRAAKVNGQFR
jgi:hypothetical protein